MKACKLVNKLLEADLDNPEAFIKRMPRFKVGDTVRFKSQLGDGVGCVMQLSKEDPDSLMIATPYYPKRWLSIRGNEITYIPKK